MTVDLASPNTDGMESLRIHFFVNFVHETGTYFRFHNLAIGLTRLGHQVKVIACDANYRSNTRQEHRDGVPYEIMPESMLRRVFGFHCDPLTILRRFARLSEACDVAHLFQPFPGAAVAWLRANAKIRFYDWDDLWVGGLMSAPVGHSSDYWSRPFVRFMEHHYLPRRADHVTAISQFLADLARERGAKAVTLLNSGSWASEVEDKTAIRDRLGLQSNAFYAGFMGRTDNELPWCFEALEANLERHPQLRLAICGPQPSCLDGLSLRVRERVDYLGQLSPSQAKQFAACMDLSLLPLEDNPFNRSRLPQKFGDYLAARVPLLSSTVGECGHLIGLFPWAIPAGISKDQWLHAFGGTVDHLIGGDVPAFDSDLFHEHLSWDGLSRKLAQLYTTALDCRSEPSAVAQGIA